MSPSWRFGMFAEFGFNVFGFATMTRTRGAQGPLALGAPSGVTPRIVRAGAKLRRLDVAPVLGRDHRHPGQLRVQGRRDWVGLEIVVRQCLPHS